MAGAIHRYKTRIALKILPQQEKQASNACGKALPSCQKRQPRRLVEPLRASLSSCICREIGLESRRQ